MYISTLCSQIIHSTIPAELNCVNIRFITYIIQFNTLYRTQTYIVQITTRNLIQKYFSMLVVIL